MSTNLYLLNDAYIGNKLCIVATYSIQCNHGRIHSNPQRRNGEMLYKAKIIIGFEKGETVKFSGGASFTKLGAKEELQ